jgi:hypothetical protein
MVVLMLTREERAREKERGKGREEDEEQKKANECGNNEGGARAETADLARLRSPGF